MFIEERHQQILEMINNHGRVEVSELCQLFEISPDSVRRDLRLMEEKGLVKRTYGGAILPEQVSQVEIFAERINFNLSEKQSIARTAVSFIEEGDTLMLDGATTTLQMIPLLINYKNLTVITNSVQIAFELNRVVAQHRLILLGGMVVKETGNAVGFETVNAIRELKVDKVFLSPCALSLEQGLTMAVYEEAAVKRVMLQAGKEIFILAGSEKFKKQQALCKFGILKPEYVLITDRQLELELKEKLEHKGLQVILSNV